MPIQIQGNMSKLHLIYVYKSNEVFFIQESLNNDGLHISFRFHAI